MGDQLSCCAEQQQPTGILNTTKKSAIHIPVQYMLNKNLNWHRQFTPQTHKSLGQLPFPPSHEIFAAGVEGQQGYMGFLKQLCSNKKCFKDESFEMQHKSGANYTWVSEIIDGYQLAKFIHPGSFKFITTPQFQLFQTVAITLRAMARHCPELVKLCFGTQANAVGFHVLQFLINGKKQHVVIDQRYPFQKDNTWPFQLNTKDVWPLFFLKALLRAFKNNKSAIFDPQVLISNTIGIPVFKFDVNHLPKEVNFQKLTNDGAIILVKTKDKFQNQKIKGLRGGQYFLVAAKPTQLKIEGKEMPILALQSSKQQQFSGKIDLKTYSKQVQDAFRLTNEEMPHISCLTSEQFEAHFDTAIVAMSHYKNILSKQVKQQFSFFKLTLHGSSPLSVRVVQYLSHLTRGTYKQNPAQILVIGTNPKVAFSNSVSFAAREIELFNIGQIVQKGEYYIRVRYDVQSPVNFKPAHLIVCCKQKIQLVQSDGLQFTKRAVQQLDSKAAKQGKHLSIQWSLKTKLGKSLLRVRNNSKKQVLCLIKFSENKNLMLNGKVCKGQQQMKVLLGAEASQLYWLEGVRNDLPNSFKQSITQA